MTARPDNLIAQATKQVATATPAIARATLAIARATLAIARATLAIARATLAIARATRAIARATRAIARATLAISMLLATAGSVWPQAAAPAPGVQEPAQQAVPPEVAPAPASPAPPREESPGLLDEIGKLIGKLPPLKGPQETIEDLNARARDAAKGASDSLSRLAKPASMVSGRMICPASANGSPDCKLGADKLCQSKGYKEGKSLNTDSAETCSPKVLIPGRARKPDDCRTDNYVTSALCQ